MSWQDNSDGSWSELIGDYTGRWPLQPPPRLDTGDSIVLFTVGTPAPIGPLAINEFDGASNPTWTTMLAAGTPPTWIFAGGVYGDPEPVSPVLVLTVNTVSGEIPPNEPDWYVPVGYAASGSAPQERSPGQWSEWQSGFVRTATASSESDDFVQFSGSGHWQEDAFVNFVPQEQPTFEDALADMHFGPNIFLASDQIVTTDVNKASPGLTLPDRTSIDIAIGQRFRRWHASSFGDPDPTSGIPGAKWEVWSPNPADTFGRSYQYEESSAINSFIWLPENWGFLTPYHATGLSATVHVDQVIALPTASASIPIVGEPLATLEDFNAGTATVTATVQPTGTDHDIVLSWYVDNLVSGEVGQLLPATDSSPPFHAQYQVNVNEGGFDYQWTTSPWRYWLAGLLVDSRAPSTAITKWHGWGAVLQ